MIGQFRARRVFASSVLIVASALAACGGGGGSATSPAEHTTTITTPTPAAAGGAVAPASFSISIPGAQSSGVARRALAVSSTTQSAVFTLLKTDSTDPSVSFTPTAPFDLSSTSKLCSAPDQTGARTCSLSISAPIGDDIYTVDTYSTTNAAPGSKLGSGAVNLRVLKNVANTASISLGGTIAKVVVTALTQTGGVNFSPPYPNTTTTRIYVFGFDAQGNVILTPDTFTTPVTLALSLDALPTPTPAPTSPPLSVGRHPLVAPTPTPVPTLTPFPGPFAQVNVTYANPAGVASALTTDGGASIVVASPNDVVTLTALAGSNIQGQTRTLSLTATVNGTTSTVQIAIAPVVAATPTPLPTASATPASTPTPITSSPPTPTPIPTSLAWSADPSEARFTTTSQFVSGPLLQFLSPTDPPANVTLNDNGPLLSPLTWTTTGCDGLVAVNSIVTPPASGTFGAGTTKLTIAPNGVVADCTLTATDNRVPAQSATLTIFVNSLTGTIH